MWIDKAEKQKAAEGAIDVLFLGDSITQLWAKDDRWPNGQKIWDINFKPLKAINLGVAGDTTCNLIWRISDGKMIDSLSPKVTVLMIGTNNLHQTKQPTDQIAGGVGHIIKMLREKLPGSKILLLGVFPRMDKDSYYQGKRVDEVNVLLPKYADWKDVFYLNINDRLLNPDGSSSKEIIRDGCHLSEKGYAIWAESMKPYLLDLLGTGGKGDVWEPIKSKFSK